MLSKVNLNSKLYNFQPNISPEQAKSNKTILSRNNEIAFGVNSQKKITVPAMLLALLTTLTSCGKAVTEKAEAKFGVDIIEKQLLAVQEGFKKVGNLKMYPLKADLNPKGAEQIKIEADFACQQLYPNGKILVNHDFMDGGLKLDKPFKEVKSVFNEVRTKEGSDDSTLIVDCYGKF